MRTTVLAAIVVAALGAPTRAAEHPILGKALSVNDPTGDESRRSIVLLGREDASDITAFSDPTVGGVKLQLILTGAAASDRTYWLGSSGWRAIGGGYRYAGDIVRMALLRRFSDGSARLKLVLVGRPDAAHLGQTPPNQGVEALFILDVLPGGDRYCVTFGGAAGGTEVENSARRWKVVNATAEPTCPVRQELPACTMEYQSCGSCGDGICVPHAFNSGLVCSKRTGWGTSTCGSNSDCTPPRRCVGLPGFFCPGPGECSFPCQTDYGCETGPGGFCADIACRGVLCAIPCP